MRRGLAVVERVSAHEQSENHEGEEQQIRHDARARCATAGAEGGSPQSTVNNVHSL
jgi:hypothetical protein